MVSARASIVSASFQGDKNSASSAYWFLDEGIIIRPTLSLIYGKLIGIWVCQMHLSSWMNGIIKILLLKLSKNQCTDIKKVRTTTTNSKGLLSWNKRNRPLKWFTCVFRRMVTTHSAGNCPPIPLDCEHFFTGRTDAGSIDFFYDSPAQIHFWGGSMHGSTDPR